jgi:hypothetical protein
MYKELKNKVTYLISVAKEENYKERINLAIKDQGTLFKCVNELLNCLKPSSLPSLSSKQDLADGSAEFFTNKIILIRQGLNKNQVDSFYSQDLPTSATQLSTFELVSQDEICKVIMSSPSSTCVLDPIPTCLLKKSLNVLLPSITQILNRSLQEAIVPDCFKVASVKPLLKKDTLDPEQYKIIIPSPTFLFFQKSWNVLLLSNWTSTHSPILIKKSCNQHIEDSIRQKLHSLKFKMIFCMLLTIIAVSF